MPRKIRISYTLEVQIPKSEFDKLIKAYLAKDSQALDTASFRYEVPLQYLVQKIEIEVAKLRSKE